MTPAITRFIRNEKVILELLSKWAQKLSSPGKKKITNYTGTKWSELINHGTAHIDYSGQSVDISKQFTENHRTKWELLIKTGTAHINQGWADS